MHLLQCAARANDRGRGRFRSPSEENVPVPLSAATASTYRQRARELVVQAESCKTCRPDMVGMFAMFLLTCDDTSFRDPARRWRWRTHSSRKYQNVTTRGQFWLWPIIAPATGKRPTKHFKSQSDFRPTASRPTSTRLLGSMIHWQSAATTKPVNGSPRFAPRRQQEGSRHIGRRSCHTHQQSGDD